MQDHEELKVREKFTSGEYEGRPRFPAAMLYILTNRARKAAVPAPAVAEGPGEYAQAKPALISNKAVRSENELGDFLLPARDVNEPDRDNFARLYNNAFVTSVLWLSLLIKVRGAHKAALNL